MREQLIFRNEVRTPLYAVWDGIIPRGNRVKPVNTKKLKAKRKQQRKSRKQ